MPFQSYDGITICVGLLTIDFCTSIPAALMEFSQLVRFSWAVAVQTENVVLLCTRKFHDGLRIVCWFLRSRFGDDDVCKAVFATVFGFV